MQVNFNILNQKGAPAVYEDSLANRPAASFAGRLFVDTDAPTSTGIYRDTGTSWQLIAAAGGTPVNIYNSDGTLTGNRVIIGNNNNIDFNGNNNFDVTNANNIKLETFVSNKRLRIENLSNNKLELSVFNLATSNNTSLSCEDNFILTRYNGNAKGFYADFVNDVYILGKQNSPNSNTFVISNIGNDTAYTQYNGALLGFNFDYVQRSFIFGIASNSFNRTRLSFSDVNQTLETSSIIGTAGFFFNFATGQYSYGGVSTANATRIFISDNNREIVTQSAGSPYGWSVINTPLQRLSVLGEYSGSFNNTSIRVDDTNNTIFTGKPAIDINYSTNIMRFGQQPQNRYVEFSPAETSLYHNVLLNLDSRIFRIKSNSNGSISTWHNSIVDGIVIDYNAQSAQYGINSTPAANRNVLEFDGLTRQIRTLFNSTDYTGINIDYTNRNYKFGNFDIINTNNNFYLELDNTSKYFTFRKGTSPSGLAIDFQNYIIEIGDVAGAINSTNLIVDDDQQQIFTTNALYQGGFNLLLGLKKYTFGQITTGFQTNLQIDENLQQAVFSHNNNANGLRLDFNSFAPYFLFGGFASANQTHISIADSSQQIIFNNQGISQGIFIDYINQQYIFGRLSGGNTTKISIVDTATYPILLDGTNITSATAGGSSGQHLKVKINGVDYKIKLENP
jgi:hypothetical protein